VKKPLATAVTAILLLQMVSLAWAWEIERPGAFIEVNDRVENAYTDGYASVGLGASIDWYLDNYGAPYGSADVIKMNVSMTANSRE